MTKIVIDIPEDTYNHLRNGGSIGASLMIENAIKNGTPLPKGHGDIVDIETLIDMFWDGNSMEITKNDLSVIEPIIEADKELSLEEVINKPSKDPIGFNIDDLDSLSETAELIFKNKVGTAELFVGGKDYLVMQHDLNKPVSEQVYDVYSVQETLGMKVPFDDMVQKIKDDIIQSIQMGR